MKRLNENFWYLCETLIKNNNNHLKATPLLSHSSIPTTLEYMQWNKHYTVADSTSSKVGEVVGSSQDRRTVPAPVGEQFLADVDDLTSGSNYDRHQFQITTTYQTLVLLQSDRTRVCTVRCPVPEWLPPPATQRPAMQVMNNILATTFNIPAFHVR